MPRITASGWSVQITHPQTGRVIRPDVISPNDVQYLPGPNTLPEIRIPVRRAPEWLAEQYDDNPALSVHLDGEELPIDELVDVEHSEGRTILVGEGGTELRTRVEAEYDAERRPDALVSLVNANTSYATVDNTTGATQSTSTVQSPSGESELSNAITLADTDPFVFTGGGIKPAQTCFVTEAENADRESGVSSQSDSNYSNGLARGLSNNADYLEFDFTLNYDIPSGEFALFVRYESTGNAEVTYSLDGTTLATNSTSTSDTLFHEDISGLGTWSDPGQLTAGSHTLRIELTNSDGSFHIVDTVAPADGRYSYTLDNTVNTTDGYLDGPELYPVSINAEFDEYTSAFSVVAGELTSSTWTDTSGAQALALSNDFGATYPISASNTTTVSGSFPSAGSALNLRATLARYSPNGTRDQTPREGYDAQRLDAYTLDATISAESLLIDESFDNNLVDVLNSITGEQYGWTYSVEKGTPTVTVDEPGSTVATRDPEVSEAQINKRVQTYATVTIKGSALPVDNETFSGSSSFVGLNEDRIQTGSEAVTDGSGTQFARGVDYEINYRPGEIRVLSGGDMTTGTDYQISYRHQILGSHTVPNATGDELVRTIPGVVSDRQAEQIAFVLAEVYPGVATPRYSGTIVVPRLSATFDPLEGLELDQLDLPDVATPLSIRGDPELTPLGLTLNLGSAPRLQESLSEISETVGSLAERS